MKREIKIGNHFVGEGHPTFIVAEISSNHKQDFEMAKNIIIAAKKSGVDAVKMQTFTPDTITLDSQKKCFWVDGDNNPGTWKGQTFYELYKKAYAPWEWHEPLQKLANELGLVFFSSPFDTTAVKFLDKLNVPCFKIAAYEATDILLLREIAKTGKPVIISVGFATLEEIEYSIKTLLEGGTKDIAILHCTASYNDSDSLATTHLRTMQDIADRFNVVVGFSDNMGGIKVPALASAMGASIIEKHLVLKHDQTIFDDRFSLDPSELSEMVKLIRSQEEAMGSVQYGARTPEEMHNKRFRRSLFVSKDMKKGEAFSMENVRSVRPAEGLETKYIDDVLGRKATCDIEFATPLSWDLVDN